MKKNLFILIILTVGFYSCEKQDSITLQNEYLVVDSHDINRIELYPNEIIQPELLNSVYHDGSYIFDFENDRLCDIEILAMNNDLYKGIGLRSIPNQGRLIYVSMDAINELDTINIKLNWTLLGSSDITMLVTESTLNNWSDFKYLAIREYYQNQNIDKYYWVRLRLDNTDMKYEIDSYFK